MPRIFFTNHYMCKKKIAAGEADPSSSIDTQFAPHEANQIMMALRKMAEANPEIDFNIE